MHFSSFLSSGECITCYEKAAVCGANCRLLHIQGLRIVRSVQLIVLLYTFFSFFFSATFQTTGIASACRVKLRAFGTGKEGYMFYYLHWSFER